MDKLEFTGMLKYNEYIVTQLLIPIPLCNNHNAMPVNKPINKKMIIKAVIGLASVTPKILKRKTFTIYMTGLK